jgi:hypothetical protein
MEVRFVYDEAAIYVGARMFSSAPIQAPLGRRDDSEQSEHLRISFDTYLDRRTAATFGVTASGVRLDHYYSSDDKSNEDATFTPVWRARTVVDDEGWTAELWIPFSQLRFNDRTPQIWGLNIQRFVPSRNEEIFWALVGRTDERWASRFGDLHGLDGIRPRRRLELLPYVASGARLPAAGDPADPFRDRSLTGRAGADIKVGLGSNLTLEATANPDFGQVEADPALVNLSAFENFFEERRPFFVEGANLLTGNVNNYFYSRRIGAAPSAPAAGEFVDYPRTTTILGAAKLTGRLSSGTSLGFLGAVTGEASARTFDASQLGRVRVAPRTLYGVGRVEQEFGPPGSNVGLMATTVNRQLSPSDPLSALLTRSASSISADTVARFGNYELQGYLGLAHVAGEPAAILRLQRSSARYYQRPDTDRVRLDPLRTSMSGLKGGISIERQNGRHWLWRGETAFETPGFETNDIGRLTTSDGRLYNAEIEYRETVPGRWFREYSVNVTREQEWNFDGDLQASFIGSEASITWPNFWSTDWTTELELRRQDMRLTRGGPSMERPRVWRTGVEIETNERSQTTGGIEAWYGRNEDGGLWLRTVAALTVRPAPQWQLTITPSYEREVDTQQYVATLPGGAPATFGSRYIFGQIDRSTYSTQLRLNYTFRPDLNLDFYGEPFAASGRYDRYGELLAARTRLLRIVEPAVVGDRDFNVRSFRSNLVLRYEWRPGSTFYLVWQQNRQSNDALRTRASIGDMFGSVTAPGDNFFAIKASFWISPR